VDGLWATKSEDVELIVRAISFQDFQLMWPWSTNVADKQTDGRTTCNLNGARCGKMFCDLRAHKVSAAQPASWLYSQLTAISSSIRSSTPYAMTSWKSGWLDACRLTTVNTGISNTRPCGLHAASKTMSAPAATYMDQQTFRDKIRVALFISAPHFT